MMLAGLGLVSISCSTGTEDDSTRDEGGEIVEGGEVGVFAIKKGDCLGGETEGEIQSVDGVPCSEPHVSEVYHVAILSGTDFPGDVAVGDTAGELCLAQFEPFVGAPYETSIYDISLILPSADTWADGDREALCLVETVDGSLITGSVEGAAE